MIKENLLRDILSDAELQSKYGLTDEMIKNARLAGPYDHPIIEYLSTILLGHMDQHLSGQTIYNKIKQLIKIS